MTLRPCPKCGNQPILDGENYTINGAKRLVYYRCVCATELADNEADARRIWNRRAPSPEAEALAAAVEKGLESYPDCPFCGADLHPVKDCRHCPIDHMSGECFHDGKHRDDCIGIAALAAYRAGKGE